jgi:hypothetical protein
VTAAGTYNNFMGFVVKQNNFKALGEWMCKMRLLCDSTFHIQSQDTKKKMVHFITQTSSYPWHTNTVLDIKK